MKVALVCLLVAVCSTHFAAVSAEANKQCFKHLKKENAKEMLTYMNQSKTIDRRNIDIKINDFREKFEDVLLSSGCTIDEFLGASFSTVFRTLEDPHTSYDAKANGLHVLHFAAIEKMGSAILNSKDKLGSDDELLKSLLAAAGCILDDLLGGTTVAQK